MLCALISNQPEVRVEGIFSHLPAVTIQMMIILLNQLKSLKNFRPNEKNIGYKPSSMLNSSGIERFQKKADMVRLGLGLWDILTIMSSIVSLTTK